MSYNLLSPAFSLPQKDNIFKLTSTPKKEFKLISPIISHTSPKTDPKYYKSDKAHGYYSVMKSIDPKIYSEKYDDKMINPKVYDKSIYNSDQAINRDVYSDESINPKVYNYDDTINDLDIKIASNSIDLSVNSASTINTNPKLKKKKKDLNFDITSNEKPPYSYATLIGISILSHPSKKLTLSQIYSWISSTFNYYKREDLGWQNSIRHNLSLNKAFLKGEKSKDGKGHYWLINDGFEDIFLKKNFVNLLNITKENEKSNKFQCEPILPSSPVKQSDENDNDEEHEDSDIEGDLTRVIDTPKRFKSISPPAMAPFKRQKLGDPFWEKLPSLTKSLPDIHLPDIQSTPPELARKNLTYSSSFSCNSNFEFSPLRSSETGPLLEPLTPGKLNNGLPSNSLLKPQILSFQSHLQKTPKAIKTPLKNFKTPQSSIMRKLWNSPSYLEEFYSPLITHAHHINSYDDDDMILRNLYPSPNVLKKLNTNIAVKTSKNLLHELKNPEEMDNKEGKEDLVVKDD